jgi:hypothetical protein
MDNIDISRTEQICRQWPITGLLYIQDYEQIHYCLQRQDKQMEEMGTQEFTSL